MSLALWDPFFSDSFIRNAHQEFQNRVRNAVQAFNRPDLSFLDEFDSYRRLRSFDLQQEALPIVHADDEHNQKIALDVAGYPRDNLKVTCTEDGYLVVEGKTEKKDGDSVSKKCFRRRFNLPATARPQDVKSSLSADGVLTILLPKQEKREELLVPIEFKESTALDASTHPTSPVPMSAPVSTKPTESKAATEQAKEVPVVTPQSSDAPVPMDVTRPSSLFPLFPSEPLFSGFEAAPILPISRRDFFFRDPFFEDTHHHFQNAIRDVLSRSRAAMSPHLSDFGTAYRGLRDHGISEESRAVKLSEDEAGHKIVLDVSGFNDGDLKVRCLGNDLLVEGHHETKDEAFSSKRSFSRKFRLPGLNLDGVRSSLSSDGILTVFAPKKAITQ